MRFNFLKRRSKKTLLILAAAMTGSLAYAGVLINSQYVISIPTVGNGNGSSSMVSPGYKIQSGTLGQSVSGSAQSAHYQNSGGFANQIVALANPPAANLGDVYVYPNPFKPNSPGSFQADHITFKHLPADATIKIFTITGKLVVELHKADSSSDEYPWNVTNSDGHKLASGVYLYFMTSPNGGKAKGKFGVIR